MDWKLIPKSGRGKIIKIKNKDLENYKNDSFYRRRYRFEKIVVVDPVEALKKQPSVKDKTIKEAADSSQKGDNLDAAKADDSAAKEKSQKPKKSKNKNSK